VLYYVTFPVKYGPDWDHGQTPHPILRSLDARHDWAEIVAPDYDVARDLAFRAYGQAWAFLYTPDEWVPDMYSGSCVDRRTAY
jgi:hypothetical protein